MRGHLGPRHSHLLCSRWRAIEDQKPRGGSLNLPFNVDRALQRLSKVTLPGGVVGKVTIAVIVASFAFAWVAWSAKNVWIAAGALVAIFALAFPLLWRLISFADRHPQAALFEGAEFLVHEQMVHASKTTPTVPAVELEPEEPESVEGPDADPELAQIPDRDAAQINQEGGAS